jgi:hypothetical protein
MSCSSVEFAEEKWEVFVTLFPRFPPPWPAPLWCQVFDGIKIAMSLMVCFYRDDSITDGKTMATFSSQKLSPKVPEAPPVC